MQPLILDPIVRNSEHYATYRLRQPIDDDDGDAFFARSSTARSCIYELTPWLECHPVFPAFVDSVKESLFGV